LTLRSRSFKSLFKYCYCGVEYLKSAHNLRLRARSLGWALVRPSSPQLPRPAFLDYLAAITSLPLPCPRFLAVSTCPAFLVQPSSSGLPRPTFLVRLSLSNIPCPAFFASITSSSLRHPAFFAAISSRRLPPPAFLDYLAAITSPQLRGLVEGRHVERTQQDQSLFHREEAKLC